jgi:hypothetical protein
MKLSYLLLVLSLGPTTALAQDARLSARLDPATLTAVSAAIDSNRAEGLPTEPLVQKALEGASKGASGQRIVQAVHQLAGTLRLARSALGAESSTQELVAGAAALRAGAAPEALRSMRQARSTGLAVPLAVLADLVALGFQVESAYRSVMDLVRTEASDEEFIRLKTRSREHIQP